MEKNFYRVVFALLVLSLGSYYLFFWRAQPFETTHQQTSIPPELENRVFNWKYDIGWDFRVEMTREKVYWEGLTGTFEGMSHTVYPHYTKINDHTYFITWPITRIGVDSLVVDVKNNKVYAHTKANAKFYAIQGDIYCDSVDAECTPPKRKG